MATAVTPRDTVDVTDVPHVLRASLKLGLLTAVCVLLFSLVSKHTAGMVENVLSVAIVLVGLLACTFWPGIWTNARTVEGISGAAGIGLAASVVYLVIDIALLVPIGTYSNRWAEIGGGSNWWYHPVWWMVAAYLPWLGSWIQANNAAKSGSLETPKAAILAIICTAVVGGIAIAVHFPGAGVNLGTFAVASLAGLPLAVLVSNVGTPKS
jgi:hypothetical protein